MIWDLFLGLPAGATTPSHAAFMAQIPQLERLGIKVKKDKFGEGVYILKMGTNEIRFDARRYNPVKGYKYSLLNLFGEKEITGNLSAIRMYNLLRKVF